MLLDKSSKKILKLIIKLSKDNDYIGESEKLLEHLPSSFTHNDVNDSLWNLEANGLVDVMNADNTIYDVELTYEGKHFFEFKWLKTKQFIIHNVFSPIVVAFFTTLITIWLNKIFNII